MAIKIEKLSDEVSRRLLLNIKFEAEAMASMVTSEVKKLLARGISEQEIARQFTEQVLYGGRVADTLKRGYLGTMSKPLVWIENEAVHQAYPQETKWVWVSVSHKNRCPDCTDRHGQVATWEQWEAMGLPGYGATVCGYYCMCQVLPESGYDGPVPEAIDTISLAELREKYQAEQAGQA